MSLPGSENHSDSDDLDIEARKRPKKEPAKGSHRIFIHKLYKMLEDPSIRHLIWWSDTNDSFLLTPSEEFSKVLLTYFKHSNVASFVRQLNMYGFHKRNDVSSSDKSKDRDQVQVHNRWEFAHSSGSFRRGDFAGLRNIRRRSSKNPQVNNTRERQNSEDRRTSESEPLTTEIPPGISNPDDIVYMRLSELNYNLAALRHDHQRLQIQYDQATEDLRRTNLDMVHLLDIVQKSVKDNSPLESDFAQFKSSILQRAQSQSQRPVKHADSFTDPNVNFQQYPFRYMIPQKPQSPSKVPGVFLHDNIFASDNPKQRSMSILCDPLAPVPTSNSPSTDSRMTMFSPESQAGRSSYLSSVSSSRTSDGSLALPYGTFLGHFHHGIEDNRDMKRHSSNDVLFDRSRMSGDSIKSQSTITGFAPRSVPDIYNSFNRNSIIEDSKGLPHPPPPPPQPPLPHPPAPHRSLSTSSNFDKTEKSASDVYSLLNHEKDKKS